MFGRGKNRAFLFRFQQADFVGGHAQIVTQIAPVHFANGYEIADGNNHGGAEPGYRAGPANAEITDVSGQPDGGERTHQQLGKACNQRNGRLPHALKSVAEDENLSEKNVEQGTDVQILSAGVDNLFGNVIGEYRNHVFADKAHQKGNENAETDGHERTVKNAAANAFNHAGAEILRRKGGHGDAKGDQRLSGQLLNTQGGGKGGDGVGTERVADFLHNKETDGENRELNGHRYGDIEMFFHEGAVVFPVFAAEAENRKTAADVNGAANAGNGNGNKRTECRTDDAQFADGYQEKVEQHVDDRRGNEKIERGFAVAQSADKT